MSELRRPQPPSRGRLYTSILVVVVAALVTLAGSTLFVTTGGSLLGIHASTFGIDHGGARSDSARVEVTLRRAREAAWAGRHNDAIAAFDSVLVHRPADREVALERARTLGWAERWAEAADALAALPPSTVALGAGPAGAHAGETASELDLALQRAKYLWWAGRSREADSLLSVVRAAHPEVAEAAELQALVRPSVEPALEVAARWVAERPDDPWPNLWLARALVGEGRAAASLAHYRVALGAPGTVEPEVLLEAAGVALGADSLALAGQILSRYLRDVDPPDWETRLRLARAYAWSGRYTAAAEQYRQVLAQTGDAEVHLELTRMLARAGRWDEAIAGFTTLLADRESPALRAELARALAGAGRYADAAGEMARVLVARPDDIALRLDRARWLWWAGRMEPAEAELDRVLGASPGHAEAVALRAEVRRAIDPDVARARAWLDEDDTPANRLHLARALVRAGQLEDALDHYDWLLASAAGDATAGVAAADLVIEAADVADAAGLPHRRVELLERHLAAAASPAPDLLLLLARALAWAERPADAASVYAAYLAARPADLEARLERARQLAWSDSTTFGEARAELGRVLEDDPAHAGALALLADLDRWTGPGPAPDSAGLPATAAAASPVRDATAVAWAAELEVFSDTEGFDWVGSGIRREWRMGANALSLRLTQGYTRGLPAGGATSDALGFGAVLVGRLGVAPGWWALAEGGVMSYRNEETFPTWGAGVEFNDDLTFGRLRYGRSPAVREAATLASLQAGAVLDRVHLEGSRYLGPWRLATDLQFQRFSGDGLLATDRYAAMLVVDRALGGSGLAMGPMVRFIGAPDQAPSFPGWGRLYWTPEYYVAPALSLRYGATVAEGLWLGLRAAPGLAFIDEGGTGDARYPASRTAILEAGVGLGYRAGPWSLELAGDWGGALPDGYNASALRFLISRSGGLR
jgi:hypothetical protein